MRSAYICARHTKSAQRYEKNFIYANKNQVFRRKFAYMAKKQYLCSRLWKQKHKKSIGVPFIADGPIWH